MHKLGLKVWSTNGAYREPAARLYAAGAFQFIEIAVPAESRMDQVAQWQGGGYPVVLHAPHSYCGLNMAQAALEAANFAQIERLDQACGLLRPELVIFHSGMDGTVEEAVRQMAAFRARRPAVFERAVVENKPRVGFEGQRCIGASPEEIRTILAATGLGFCLDVGHAICYANWAGRPWAEALEEFLAIGPAIYHLSDGDATALVDSHEHPGQGSFDLGRIVRMIPDGALVTIEARKESREDLDDFLRDAAFLRGCTHEH